MLSKSSQSYVIHLNNKWATLINVIISHILKIKFPINYAYIPESKTGVVNVN